MVASDRFGPIDMTGVDVTASQCLSIDLRREFGADVNDETTVVPAGTFRRALFGSTPGELPTGEIRLLVDGVEVRVVAEETGRHGIVEITAPAYQRVTEDPQYKAQWREYLRGLPRG